jgi:uncharacterized UPF0160 family protein
MKQPRSVGIHDGTFHADEVTACALLITFNLVDVDKIIRSRDPAALANCEFVCDVGGVYDPSQKLFDHHQVSYHGDLSSAGMVLDYLKLHGMIHIDEFQLLNISLVLGVDAHDNGRAPQLLGVTTFSHIISNFNPTSAEMGGAIVDVAFYQALDFVMGHLCRLHKHYIYNQECRKIVKEVMETHSLCLFFDQSISWLECFFSLGGKGHSALFVIMPARGHWKLRGIPPDYEHRMQVRLPLPEEWAGLLGEELKKVSKIPGAIFCHKGRFTSVWETKADAIQALKYVLDKHQVKYENTF